MSILNLSFFAKDRNITKRTLFYFGFPLCLLFLGRTIFFFFYLPGYQAQYSFSQNTWALLYGLRFDFSVVFLVYGLFYWLVLLSPPHWQLRVLKLLVILTLPLSLFFFSLQLADIPYFNETGRHVSFEIFFLFSDFLAIAKASWKSYWFIVLGVFFSFLCISYFWLRFYKKLTTQHTSFKPFSWLLLLKEVLLRGVIFFVIVLLARGGWQLKPLNISHSFIQGNQNLGNLSLSAPFTLLEYLSHQTIIPKPKDWLPKEIAVKKTQKLLVSRQEIFLNPNFPFYRRFDFSKEEKKTTPTNIVFLVMETWGGRFISTLRGDNPETTPNFNRLSKEGLLFKQFYSSGRRSIQSMASVFFSLPNSEVVPIYQSPFVSNKMSSLAQQLKKENYETIFFHGGKENSLNLHSTAGIAGYQKIFSLADFPNKEYDGVWGLWDHDAFDLFAVELSQLKQPFYGLFFSLSSHDPYNLPEERFRYFKKDTDDYKYLNSLRYSDWALGEFFKKVEQTEWYKNTIFVITADHSRGISDNFKKNFNIPLLIFSPSGLVTKGISYKIGSHIDLTPTILALAKNNQPFLSAGKNLLVDNTLSATLISSDLDYWITEKYLYIFNQKDLLKVLDFQTSQEIKNPLLETIHQTQKENFQSFFQTNFNAILENKLIP